MGGNSGQIQEDSLLAAYNKLKEIEATFEVIGLFLDSLSIVFKHDDKQLVLGSNGIEVNVNAIYLPKPKKKITMMYHFHS